jgi:tetratricopeptide (TPR) repeat protein
MLRNMRAIVPGVLLAVAFGAPAAGQEEPSVEQRVKDFESRIAEAGRHDRDHPAALEARLDYANVLAGLASEECSWLPRSQAQLETLGASPLTRLVLPDGEARVLAIEYRILAQQAHCSGDAAEDAKLTRAALEKARIAKAAYEQAYDYLNAAIMQFNIAAAHRRLEENDRAIAELEKAIEFGKTYGLRADVEENYGYLQEWRGGEQDPAAIQTLMEAWPLRKASFKFAWQPGQQKQRFAMETAQITAGKLTRSTATVAGTSTVARKGREWTQSGEYALENVTFPAGGDEVSRKMAEFLTRMLANVPSLTITREGEFKEMPGLEAWSARLDTEARAFMKGLFAAGDPRLPQLDAMYEANIAPSTRPEVLLAHSRETHNLQVAVWTGATLEHGEAYEMPGALRMPGTPQGQLDHKLEFTVTRWLPCTSKETEPRCVEVVLRGIPDAKAVGTILENLGKQRGAQAPWEYWAHTVMRLVTDPATLVPYASDFRRYSYIAHAGAKGRATEVKSERHATTVAD